MLGTSIRIAVLALWLGLTGWYVLHQVLPELGLTAESDPSATLAARVGKAQHYDLLWRSKPGSAASRVGSCSLGVFTDDVGLRLETQIDITSTRFLPGEAILRQAIGGRGKGLRLRLDEQLDAGMRLRQIDVSGNVFGVQFSAQGPVDHRGLHLSWTAAGSSGTREVPEVRPERVAGSELAASLPAGLKPGQRFATRISTLDPTRLRLATKEAVYVVLPDRLLHRTAAGNADLLQVEMRQDGRPFAKLLCDDRGTVHRQELLEAGLILDLTRVADQYGAQIWPAAAPPAMPPPAVRRRP